MKKILTIVLVAFLATGSALAQQPQQSVKAAVKTDQKKLEVKDNKNCNHDTAKDAKHECNQDGKHAKQGGKHCGNCPNHQRHQAKKARVNADGIDMAIVTAFPTVKSIKKTDKFTEVYDAKKQLLGYVVYSKPASNGIKGYNGETPLLIALSAKKKITGVWMLDNSETPGYVKRVVDAGLFKAWNGMKISKARKAKVDAVAGATYTSRSVIQSLQAALRDL